MGHRKQHQEGLTMTTRTTSKFELRAETNELIAEYLARGGRIRVAPPRKPWRQ
jgi:hypothetical protein